MANDLRIATFNIHKGFSALNRRMTVHELRQQLRKLDADIVFLQEVQGEHHGHAARLAHWPALAQAEFLAEDVWPQIAYGRNVSYPRGHHGNAILARLPMTDIHNQDVTHWRFERRGLLHCTVRLPAKPGASGGEAVHCVCVHLSLFGHSRQRQMNALAEHIETAIAADAPLIVAGDFNDWRNRADAILARRLGLREVFAAVTQDTDRGCGQQRSTPPVRSFPAGLPLLRLDRIYVRGFSVKAATLHFAAPGIHLSDHAALSAELVRDAPARTRDAP